MNIGIVGAGGIGSYFAGTLSRAGYTVRLLARGEHLDAVHRNGLEVRTPTEIYTARPVAIDDPGELASCSYVLVAVKSYSLPEVAPSLVAAAHRGATIVSLLNGVDVAERLEARGVPRGSVLGGLVTASLVRSAPGVVERRSAFDRVVVGELDGGSSDRARTLVAAFVAAGSDARESEHVRLDLWRKFAFIVPMNVACGLTRGPMGLALATDRGRALVTGALDEIVAVSRAGDTPLDEDDAARIRRDLLALAPEIRPSFLADLERGGPTELDLLVGAVSRLGGMRGVPTPIHDVATAAFEAATRAAK
jgi:2-dehydropantoate 2-reductase